MKKKIRIWIYPLIIMGLVFILSSSCDRENEEMQQQPPVLSTRNVYSITPNSAICEVDIVNDGGAKVSARGVCWNTIQNPTIADSKTAEGTGTGTFTSSVTGLTATTTYHIRAYATNSIGTGYGNELSFKTYTGTVVDIEGNEYNIIRIGTQTWMAENLKTTKFNDNTDLERADDPLVWEALSTPGYCWYNNIPSLYKINYGTLYNFFVVDATGNGGKNICPAGWHVPTDDEWTTLTTFLGGDTIAGGKMKVIGTTQWLSPNAGATNESGFSGLPGGGRYNDGFFAGKNTNGCWWSSTKLITSLALGRFLYYDHRLIHRGTGYKQDGFYVRCLKD
jgi:uncharacterized protein (TIGR02145 family)